METKKEPPRKNIRPEGVFLTGKYINLKILTTDDVINSDWYDWFNNEETTQFMQQHYYPNTRQKQLDFFNELEGQSDKIQLGIATKPDSEGTTKLIGVTSFSNISYINQNAEISMIIGDKANRSHPVSLDIFNLMLKHGFLTLNFHKIWVGHLEPLVLWRNSIKQIFGFEQEGCYIEEVYKNGKYLNVYRLYLLKRNYIKLMEKEGHFEKKF